MTNIERMRGQIDILTDVCFFLMETRTDGKRLHELIFKRWHEVGLNESVDYRGGITDTIRSVFKHEYEPEAWQRPPDNL